MYLEANIIHIIETNKMHYFSTLFW